MLPGQSKRLKQFDKFYKFLIEQIKQIGLSEKDFYSILALKAKSMNKARLLDNLDIAKIIKKG